jgi:hypothetical protein
MNQNLQNKLFAKYPKIFQQKDLSMQETCMCWGITCGDGWYNILDTLCSQIQHHLEYNLTKEQDLEIINVEAVQVKEKYGGLRFYYNGGDDFIRGLAWMAEGISGCTCETCGSPGTQNDTGWIHTLCSPCRDNLDEIRKLRWEQGTQGGDHTLRPIDKAIKGKVSEYEEEIELYKTYGGD